MFSNSVFGRRSRRSQPAVLAVAMFALGMLAACSGSAAESGQVVIEDELADKIGLGALEATCNEPDGLEKDETFTCTATTTDDRTIEFVGTMTSDSEFEIVTSNLLTVEDVDVIREDAATVLSEEIGQEIAVDDIACPDGVILLDETGEFLCEITDTSTGSVYELTVSTGGIEPGVGVRELSYQIGDAPL